MRVRLTLANEVVGISKKTVCTFTPFSISSIICCKNITRENFL